MNLSILINITEEPASCSETLSSLQFSTNCKKITNKIFLQTVSNKKKEFNEEIFTEMKHDLAEKDKIIMSYSEELD